MVWYRVYGYVRGRETVGFFTPLKSATAGRIIVVRKGDRERLACVSAPTSNESRVWYQRGDDSIHPPNDHTKKFVAKETTAAENKPKTETLVVVVVVVVKERERSNHHHHDGVQ